MSSNGNGTDEILKPRAEWIVKRKLEAARTGDTNLSQMHFARKGQITEEMAFVAEREKIPVGLIRDEHEGEDEDEAVIREPDGSWAVPGNLDLEQLEELMGEVELPEDYDATTVAGLVSEAAGRIPQAGEVIEVSGLRFEVLASTDRRIDRLRVSRMQRELKEG